MKLNPFTYQISSDSNFINTTSISLDSSSCIGICGPVGSGKSTLIKLLADPELKEIQAFSESPFVSYLSQDLTRLFLGNTLQSIIKLYEDSSHQIGKYFRSENFYNYCEMLNFPLQGRLNDRLNTFSEGELQRLAIALASAVEAKVTLFDEPTTALNFRHKEAFYSLAQEIKKRSRIFIISHSLSDILALTDKIIRIENLEIKEVIETKQILEKSDYLRYFRP